MKETITEFKENDLGVKLEGAVAKVTVAPLLVSVSIRRANVNLYGGDPMEEAKAIAGGTASTGIPSIAIDAEQAFISFGLVKQICYEMKGRCLRLEKLSALHIASVVCNNLNDNTETVSSLVREVN